MEDFNKTLDKISVKYDNVILIGDLNYNVLSPVYTIKVFHQKLCQSFLWQSFLTM